MGILSKLLRRNEKDEHDKWLAANPGKGRITMSAPAISEDEQAATRARMESELSGKGGKPNTE